MMPSFPALVSHLAGELRMENSHPQAPSRGGAVWKIVLSLRNQDTDHCRVAHLIVLAVDLSVGVLGHSFS